MTAYRKFTDICQQLSVAFDEDIRQQANLLWLQIGVEQSKVPIHIAQQYCSLFKTNNFKRSVKFNHLLSDKQDFWFSSGQVHAELGVTFSMFFFTDSGDRYLSSIGASVLEHSRNVDVDFDVMMLRIFALEVQNQDLKPSLELRQNSMLLN